MKCWLLTWQMNILKTGLLSLGMATGLGEGKMNLNELYSA